MSLRFLLDENLRGAFRSLIYRHNKRGLDPIDLVCVGEIAQLPLGTQDSDILEWCEEQDRILITADRRSLPTHLENHLKSGRHSPGIFIVSRSISMSDHLELLLLIAYASDPQEWRDWIKHF